MITLITGGSKCGKSSYAEKMLDNCAADKIYLATMRPFGEEAEKAISRHREMRQNKGFKTIEKYTDIDEITLPDNCCVLLECIGNLLANEMFEKNEPEPSEKIFKGIKKIAGTASELVIVSNEVSSDGIVYSDETLKYISEINKLNFKISQTADKVIECVYGIPIILKEKTKC